MSANLKATALTGAVGLLLTGNWDFCWEGKLEVLSASTGDRILNKGRILTYFVRIRMAVAVAGTATGAAGWSFGGAGHTRIPEHFPSSHTCFGGCRAGRDRTSWIWSLEMFIFRRPSAFAITHNIAVCDFAERRDIGLGSRKSRKVRQCNTKASN